MKIAVIGGGFAGLSAAWHLADLGSSYEVTVFDKNESKASAVSAGLCHPFPGKGSRLSPHGYKALHETILLLNQAQNFSNERLANFNGILKIASNNDQKKKLSILSRKEPRTSWISRSDNVFLSGQGALYIENGITVYSEKYLKALRLSGKSKGVIFLDKSIDSLEELKDFDKIILAVGAKVVNFIKEDPSLKLVKGQVLICKIKDKHLDKSLILEGYIAPSENTSVFHIGSTYEYHFKSEFPDLCIAKSKIFENLKNSHLQLKEEEIEILDVKSGIRVVNKKTHLPTIRKLKENLYCITQLGSRGLLYHGLIGKQLASAIHTNDMTMISREFFHT